MLQWFDPEKERSPVPTTKVERWITLSRKLLGFFYGDGYCLVESLILFRLLRQHGIPVELFFGITKRNDRLRGHAWLEGGPSSLIQGQNPRQVYTITYSYPSFQHSKDP